MGDSLAGLLYGVTASVADLAAAGRAFRLMQPTLTGLELIQSRRNHSNIGNHFLNGVPAEVWSMIEDQLRSVAVTQARLDLLEAVHCEECSD